MLNKSILGKWDVICCMDASAINQVLKTEYEHELERYNKDPQAYDAGGDGAFYSSVLKIDHKTPWTKEAPVTHSVPAQLLSVCMLHTERVRVCSPSRCPDLAPLLIRLPQMMNESV